MLCSESRVLGGGGGASAEPCEGGPVGRGISRRLRCRRGEWIAAKAQLSASFRARRRTSRLRGGMGGKSVLKSFLESIRFPILPRLCVCAVLRSPQAVLAVAPELHPRDHLVQ